MSLKAKLPVLLLPLLLVGCIPEDESSLINVQWPEQRVVFVADARVGTVHAMAQNDTGRLLAKTDGALPSSVRSMVLDKDSNTLWVLGSAGIDVLDARSLDLKKHIELNTASTPGSLKQDKSGISVYSISGALQGRINAQTLAASWRSGDKTLTVARQG
jgi:ligand-binding sensor domain-containing protein